MARDEEEVQKALGTLGKFWVHASKGGRLISDAIIVEAMDIEDALVKAKVQFMMLGASKDFLDKAEYDIEPYVEN